MTRASRRFRGIEVVLLALLIFVVIYAASYMMLMRPGVSAISVGVGIKNPRYVYGGRFAKAVYLPAHQIDRLLRPDYWKPHPIPSI